MEMNQLARIDPEIHEAVMCERKRQETHLELIASENFVHEAILEVTGSWLTNKYAEGYPGRRYYGGCEFVDVVEALARDRARQLYGADHANVQPHSGTQANTAVYFTALKPGDTVLGMSLSHGGHLTHGSPVNISGRYFNFIFYGVNQETETIDYDEVMELAKRYAPKMIVAGASSYPRVIDFGQFKRIADEVGAYLMVDMAHIAGLVAAALHPSPVPHADFVTSTTHKTLRGPRGGFALCKREHAQGLDKAVFPGIQGGPLMHVIAAKAVAFKLAMGEEFREYQKRVLLNSRCLADRLSSLGYRLVSGGTDNHLVLVDLSSNGITGKEAERILGMANITVNKNAIPYDKRPPNVTSGIRLGTPALTTRGMGPKEMGTVAELIYKVLSSGGKPEVLREVKEEVLRLCSEFPIPEVCECDTKE